MQLIAKTDLLIGRRELREHICVQLLLFYIVFFDGLLAKCDLIQCCFVVWFQFAYLFNTAHQYGMFTNFEYTILGKCTLLKSSRALFGSPAANKLKPRR